MTYTNLTKQSQRKPAFSRSRERHDVPDSPFMERVQKWILHHNVELLHGPDEITYEVDELVVLVVLRNGRPYVKSFVEHYSSLGARHIVFLDNGSTDGTVEALSEYENVTVLRTRLPFKRYGICMRQYLVERFGRGRWTLSVDMDELFVYPYQDVVSLGALLRYLSGNSYTAVVANMLDMFPEKPLENVPGNGDEPLKELHRFYDISNVRRQSYDLARDTGNVLTNPDIGILRDGIRQTLFGFPALMIKHPLIFLDDEIKPMDLSEHWVGNARLADFTGTLLHYKLMDRLYETVRREVEARNHLDLSDKYDKYLAVLNQGSNLSIKTETARELGDLNELVGSRFFVVSREYVRFVEEEDRKRGNPPERHFERLSEALFGAIAEVGKHNQKFTDLWNQVNDDERQIGQLTSRVERLQEMLREERQATREERRATREKTLRVERLQGMLKSERGANRKLQRELDGNRKRAERLKSNLEENRKRTEQLRSDLAEERRRTSSLRQQIEGIMSSRSWRLLDRLNRTMKGLGTKK